MGRYNPNLPYILGQEWVPIHDEDYVYTPDLATVELGHRFSTSTAYTLVDGRFYMNRFPPALVAGQGYGINIYPAGAEDRTGPVRNVIIPCNAAGVTGNAGDIQSVTTILKNVMSPSDNLAANGYVGGSPTAFRMEFFFATNQYSQLLTGKRILGVDYLYQFSAGGTPLAEALAWQNQLSVEAFQPTLPGTTLIGAITTAGVPTFAISDTSQFDQVYSLGLSEVQIMSLLSGNPSMWNYPELAKFEATHANRIGIAWSSTTNVLAQAFFQIGYQALRVWYCEEARTAAGVYIFTPGISTNVNLNTTIVPLRNPTTLALTPSLPAGDYTVTSQALNLGWLAENQGTVIGIGLNGMGEIPMTAERQLYQISSHPGVQINHPFPLDESAVDQPFTQVGSDVLPQLSLHTSTGPLVEVHAYGRQAVAQVYSGVTATQEIYDTSIGGNFAYPQVRFYARRWGDTNVPLTLSSTSPVVSGSGMSVTLTADQFDALPPAGGIINGWKEVTLRFPTAPTMGQGTNPQWVWSANGLSAGNRWEVLGAIAPAISGVPGNVLNQINPSNQRLYAATYGAPASGAAVNLGWVPGWSPLVSATTDDQAADAVLLFSQDPPSITGFTMTNQTQAITGIGLDCGGTPCCVPTGITYKELTWTTPFPAVCDQFTRSVSNGWGTIVSGLTWAVTGGAVGDYAVNGSAGTITPTTTQSRTAYLTGTGSSLNNYDVTVLVTLSSLANVNANHQISIIGRFIDSGNFYRHKATITTATGAVGLTFDAVAGGSLVTTNGPTQDIILSDPSPAPFYLRAQADGSIMRTKVWLASTSEPTEWGQVAFDTTQTAGAVGVNTINSQVTVSFDNFLALPIALLGSSYEIQRMDDITDWKTIMLTTNLCTSRFRDYEGRVGTTNSYRIRMVNEYNFAGAWSPTITGSIAAPGVTGGACLSTAGGVLIFTSNYNQNGLYNLAYVPIFNGSIPSEDFTFPESSTVSFGRMYTRNYQVGFKPLERGGETFSRDILVQAAAVALPRLANVKALRDMAWADLPYVCVRDDIGDRWFAMVQVPGDQVRRNRRLYTSTVNITEVTDTPFAVNA